jgi:hypothetical protein
MKILKKILIILAILVAIPLIAALFVKDDYSIERSVTINKPKQDVFNYIKLLRNQTHYSKWVMMDPNAKMEYTGTDGTPGFVSAWDSENKHVGKGAQTITKVTDGERIDLDIHFIKPLEGDSKAYLATTAVSDNQTKVTWGFYGPLKYPMKVMHLFMNMDKMIGSDLQTGLDNLKGVLEK